METYRNNNEDREDFKEYSSPHKEKNLKLHIFLHGIIFITWQLIKIEKIYIIMTFITYDTWQFCVKYVDIMTY